MVRADRLIEHGDLIDVPGLRLRAVWTPGHTPGPSVLPRRDPRPAAHRRPHPAADHAERVVLRHDRSNPLDDYLASLGKLRGIQPREVLPAHEYRFADLDSRLDDLAEHHQERLAETADILAGAGAAGLTAWQVATGVTWSRPWSDLVSFQRQAAVGEVLSHLRHLQARGLAARPTSTASARWTPIAPAGLTPADGEAGLGGSARVDRGGRASRRARRAPDTAAPAVGRTARGQRVRDRGRRRAGADRLGLGAGEFSRPAGALAARHRRRAAGRTPVPGHAPAPRPLHAGDRDPAAASARRSRSARRRGTRSTRLLGPDFRPLEAQLRCSGVTLAATSSTAE